MTIEPPRMALNRRNARVEKNAGTDDNDLDLISLWIAFNALYGQWDEQKREPNPDRKSWRAFVDSLLRLDESGYRKGG